MKRRWTALLLALVLALALLPGAAQAKAADSSAGGRLTGPDREIYQYLRAEITKVAQGTRTNTRFRVPNLDSLSWTLEELEIKEGSRDNVLDKLKEKFSQTVHLERIYNCLSADLPYEMFWRGDRYATGQSFARNGDRVSVRDLTIQIQVSSDYRGGGDYTVSSSKIAAARKAAERAQAIVDQYKSQSDMEKLASYREEICRLTDYNTAAGGAANYGDPWQMIYVFDGNSDTSVVCEGYAKAFKYLCDQSSFQGNVVCRIATGTMDGGPHMWNTVQMGDGKNYLVDVTNCDSGAVGADDKLFLAGAEGSADGRTWTVSKDGLRVAYTYAAEEEDLHTDGWLALSPEDYVPGADPDPLPDSGFADVPGGAYCARPVAWAVEEEITNGTSDAAFSPDRPCTHAEILTFLWRAAGKPEAAGERMPELDGETYYAGAVRWADGLDLLADDFDSNAPCTRSDAVAYIWGAFGRPDAAVGCFDDVSNDAAYAQAVGWAVTAGITNGTSDATFEPDAVCSRGQIVTFLYRAYH